MEIQMQTMPMASLVKLIELQLDEGGVANLTVTGCSMEPLFRHRRDQVTLIRAEAKKGDIVLYRRESGRFILHRVVGIEDRGYICCGDNEAARESVQPSQVIAVVSGFVRKGKRYGLDAPGYRLYAGIWVKLFPLRRYYIFIRRRMGCLYRKCKAAMRR